MAKLSALQITVRFVELETGIEGLVHISEMSWTKRVKHPSKIVSMGDSVEAIVLDLDVNNRRISLGLKQIEQNPWAVVAEKISFRKYCDGCGAKLDRFRGVY